MRFADVDALKKNIECVRTNIVFARGNGKGFLRECFMDYRNAVLKCVDAAPTIDAVPVVRCKDCKWWGGKYSSNECSKITTLSNPDYWLKTLPEDFCSSGERKDNE